MNSVKTVLLMTLMACILMVIGGLLGGRFRGHDCLYLFVGDELFLLLV